MVPKATDQNRLMIRDGKSVENGFDRTLETMIKLKEESRKQEAQEAEEEALRNEAEEVAETGTKEIAVGSCVKVLGRCVRGLGQERGDAFAGAIPLSTEES